MHIEQAGCGKQAVRQVEAGRLRQGRAVEGRVRHGAAGRQAMTA
jgi:hypothetical protein